jgi:hypothetical protein
MDDVSMGISDDIIEVSIAEDSIELMDESMTEDSIELIEGSIEDDASCAITGSASTAATAVVARRVRIIVSSSGSTRVGHAARRGAWLGLCAARL